MNDIKTAQLLNEARKLAKEFKKSKQDYKIRIAVVGSHSIQHFVMVLRYQLYQEGITAEIFEGEYNSITMDVMDENSSFYIFQPNIVIIMNYYNDIKVMPQMLMSVDEVNAYLDMSLSYFRKLWTAISEIPDCHILQTNFVLPPIRTLGNLEANYYFTETNFYRLLNMEFIRQRRSNVTIVDMDFLASNIGKYSWYDYSAYFLHKAGFRMEYIASIVKIFVDQIKAITGVVKKCLVLDLDNTIWGGVVGDDGCNGIQLDPNHAVGEAYRFFQQYILKLKQRGVILAICSKNDMDVAQEPFIKNENMILKLEDIACFVANWEDKAGNIIRIAKELNIGTDSMVFFDDNPAERELVKSYLPEVQVINVPKDPAYYALALEKASPFEWNQVTKEDLLRSASYYENILRTEVENSFVNYNEYLSALDMKAELGFVKKEQVERFAQLINKTNQFNLRTQRYSEATIEEMRNNKNVRCVYIQLVDKYSNYGIISCVILKKQGENCFVDTWVMSCRVLKRGVEDLMFRVIVDTAIHMGCIRIIGEYIKTKKNSMVENLYSDLCFYLSGDEYDAMEERHREGERYIYYPLVQPDKKIYIERI